MEKEKTQYKLRYLPLFYEDFEGIINYIKYKLKNPIAAYKLLDDVEKAILNRVSSPESFEKYNSKKDRKNPYYRIYVKNYVIYYVVIEEADGSKVMEIRRILYGKRDWDILI